MSQHNPNKYRKVFLRQNQARIRAERHHNNTRTHAEAHANEHGFTQTVPPIANYHTEPERESFWENYDYDYDEGHDEISFEEKCSLTPLLGSFLCPNPFNESSPTDECFAQLRAAFQQPPSAPLFAELSFYVDCICDPDLRDVAIQYCLNHLSSWPTEALHWSGTPYEHPFFPVIRSLSLEHKDFPEIFRNLPPQLKSIRLLEYGNQPSREQQQALFQAVPTLESLQLRLHIHADTGLLAHCPVTLRKLVFYLNGSISAVEPYLTRFSQLEHLEIHRINSSYYTNSPPPNAEVLTLPPMPHLQTFVCNDISQVRWQQPEDFSALHTLHFGHCESIPERLHELPQLRHLGLRLLPNQEQIFPDLAQLPQMKTLKKLDLYDPSADVLRLLPQMLHLETLALSMYNTHNTEGIDESCTLPSSLAQLSLSCHSALQPFFSSLTLPHLQSLDIKDCSELTNLDSLPSLPNLRELSIFNCNALQQIDALSSFDQLQSIDLNRCIQLESIRGLAPHKHLHTATIASCQNLQTLDGLPTQQLEILSIAACPKLQDISALQNASRLHILDLYYTQPKAGLDAISTLSSLRYLRCTHDDIVPFLNASQLVSLSIEYFNMHSLEFLRDSCYLTELFIGYARDLRDIEDLSDLPQLRYLTLGHCASLQDITPLQPLTQLKKLSLHGYSADISLAPLATLQELVWLDLRNRKIENIDFLESLEQLRYLNLCDAQSLPNCDALLFLPHIKMLTVPRALLGKGSYQSTEFLTPSDFKQARQYKEKAQNSINKIRCEGLFGSLLKPSDND